jgi:chemotaxis signal transduction protein
VRNLFERTADVGFLATDDVIRAFCAADDDTRAGLAGAMRARLADDVPLERSTDPLIAEAVGSHTWRERFAPTDLVAGRREFETADGYDNGVSAMVALRLGPHDRRRSTLSEEALIVAPVRQRAPTLELGVLQVGGNRCALPADLLMQAVSHRGLVRAPSSLSHSVGMLEIQAEGASRMIQVICVRRLFGVNDPSRHGDGVVLVVRSERDPRMPALGLRVDDVLSVLEVEEARMQEVPLAGREACVTGIVDCELAAVAGKPQHDALVQVRDVQALFVLARRPARQCHRAPGGGCRELRRRLPRAEAEATGAGRQGLRRAVLSAPGGRSVTPRAPARGGTAARDARRFVPNSTSRFPPDRNRRPDPWLKHSSSPPRAPRAARRAAACPAGTPSTSPPRCSTRSSTAAASTRRSSRT